MNTRLPKMNQSSAHTDSLVTIGVDILHRLPNELLLKILKHCPDLSAVWGLIQASPRLLAIFDGNSLEIVESVCESGVPVRTWSLMRAVVHLRTGSLPGRSSHDMAEMASSRAPPAPPLRPDTPPLLLRKLVSLSHRIHALSHSCIDLCLERCDSMECLRHPRHGPYDGVAEDETAPGSSARSSRATKLGHHRPVSWFEEQRAVYGFWGLQFFFELKVARLKGRLDWTPHELGKLQSFTIQGCYGTHLRWQVLTAFLFLEDRKPSVPMEEFSATNSTSGSRRVGSEWTTSKEEFQLPGLSGINASERSCPQRPKVRQPFPGQPDQETRTLAEPPLGWKFWLRMNHSPAAGYMQAVQYMPYDPWRKFGLSLWDDQRMVEMGLCTRDLGNNEEYFGAWRDLLTEDEIAEAKRFQEKVKAWPTNPRRCGTRR